MLAVFGQIADAVAHRILRRFDRYALAVHVDLAALERIGAENRARHFRAARAHEAGETEHLAATQREAHVADRRTARQAFDFERDLVIGGVAGVPRRAVELASDHHADDGLDRRCRSGNRGHVLSVPHDRHAARDLPQFVHFVGDIDDADAMRLQLPNDTKEVLDLDVVQRRGGLVHDEHARIERERLRNLDHLLLGHRELAHRRARIELQMHALEDRGGPAIELALVDEKPEAPLRLAPDEDVLRGAQMIHQVQFLMHDADAERLGGARVGNVDRLAIDEDFPLVLLVDTR